MNAKTFYITCLDNKGQQKTVTITTANESYARAIFHDSYGFQGWRLISITQG